MLMFRVYGDVNSPGFSSRVARYAIDNSKSTHQKQYLGPGQFPLVQLDRSASKLPVVSTRRSPAIIHSPVMIRVAPPESAETRYSIWYKQLFSFCISAANKLLASLV